MKGNTLWTVISLLLLSGYLFAQTGENGKIIKVLTFNILHGATTNNDFDLDKIARVIIESDADLVALQEVDFKTARAKGYDLATELGWRSKLTPYFAMAMPFDGGGYGEAVLSRWPIIEARNISLPYFDDHEPRAIALTRIAIPSGDTIFFAGTHLDHLRDDKDRYAQTATINDELIPAEYPIILAGDLNDTPESRSMKQLFAYWTMSDSGYTIPSDGPRRKIDYVLYHPADQWSVVKSEVICDEVASDHCSLLVHLRLK